MQQCIRLCLLMYATVQNYVCKTLEGERHKTESIKGPQLQKRNEESLYLGLLSFKR